MDHSPQPLRIDTAWVRNILKLGYSTGGVALNNNANAVRFTLRYLENNNFRSQMTAFEAGHDVLLDGVRIRGRSVDATLDNLDVEIKAWKSGNITWKKMKKDIRTQEDLADYLASGGKAAGEEIEWISDVIKYAPDFSRLKWVIHSNAAGKADKLKQHMLNALDNELVAKHIKVLVDNGDLPIGYTVKNLKDDFSATYFNQIVEFVDETPVIIP